MRTSPARGIPVPGVAGSPARPCSACQPREDMIMVQSTCELLCAIPVREISVAGAPGLRRRAVRDHRERGRPRGGSGYPPGQVAGPSASRRSPGSPLPPGPPDEPSAPPRPGRRTGTCPRPTGAGAEGFTGIPRRSASCCRWTKRRGMPSLGQCDGSAGGPVSRRPSFVEPVPAATHLHHAGAGADSGQKSGLFQACR